MIVVGKLIRKLPSFDQDIDFTGYSLAPGTEVLHLKCPVQVVFHLKVLLQQLSFSIEHSNKT